MNTATKLSSAIVAGGGSNQRDLLSGNFQSAREARRQARVNEQAEEVAREYDVEMVNGVMWFTRRGRPADYVSVQGWIDDKGLRVSIKDRSVYCTLEGDAFLRAAENRVMAHAAARQGAN